MGLSVDENENEAKPKAEDDTEDRTLVKIENEDVERDTWGGKLDFFMSSLSFAVGMGNLWRFPYLCYRNGGGAFLIPYVIFTCLLGMPLLFMEYSLGQYGQLGALGIWEISPLFSGLGWGMSLLSWAVSIYYNMLIAWCFYYIFASFAKEVPWKHCGNDWNDQYCSESGDSARVNCSMTNVTSIINGTCSEVSNITNITSADEAIKYQTPSDQYFHNKVLHMTDSIDDLGSIEWGLAGCLLLVWVLCFVCLSKGIQASGKVTYVTALFPYVVLLILFVRGLMLDGAKDGIYFYLMPKWEKLLSVKVWSDAAVQVFFSMSVCWGGQITLASYNKYNNNALRDAISVAAGDTLTSIFGGIVIFSFIGYMAHVQNVPVDEVATQGAGLAFVVYPQAVTTLPISQLWTVLFMLMFINVGIGSEFALIQTAQATVLEFFGWHSGKRPLLVLLVICVVTFLLGLFCACQGGMYVLQLMDNYTATFGTITNGVFMCIIIVWIYGKDKFYNDICGMLGFQPGRFWAVCWAFISPLLIVVVLIFTLSDFRRSRYDDYVFPVGYDVLGWCIYFLELGCILGVAIYKIVTYKDKKVSIFDRIKALSRPTDKWNKLKYRWASDKSEQGNGETIEPLHNEDTV